MQIGTAETLERVGLGTAYSLAAVAGPLAIFNTPPSMQETIGPDLAAVWGVYLLIGGLGCLVGVVLGIWLPEFVFLHPLGSALAVYGVVILTTVDGDPGRAAGGLLLLAASALLFVIWTQRLRHGRADASPARRDE